jgi:hypothetical protein
MLSQLQAQLHARFSALAAIRRPYEYPVYALEHGLDEPTRAEAWRLASAKLDALGLTEEHWLVWVVLATEVGYRYGGDEYWPDLAQRRGQWRSATDRDRLRRWFRRFRDKYGGPEPVGRWADQFSIISWPIANAILPQYLQALFARHLFELRHALAHHGASKTSAVGAFLLERYDGGSSRLEDFLQQTDITGPIVVALRDDDPALAIPRIDTAVLKRLIEDLEEQADARDILSDTRRVLKIGRVSLASPLAPRRDAASFDGTGEASVRPPRLAARLTGEGHVTLGLILSNISSALQQAGLTSHLERASVRLPGSDTRWRPAQILLSFANQERLLETLPAPFVPAFDLKDADANLSDALRPFLQLEERAVWVLRREGDGLYRQVRGGHVRAGQTYLLLARTSLQEDDRSTAGLSPALAGLSGASAYWLQAPDRIGQAQQEALTRLGIGLAFGVRIAPVGLSPRPVLGGASPRWLTTETPILRFRTDGPVEGFCLQLDGRDIKTIQSNDDVLIAFDQLAPGTHTLTAWACLPASATTPIPELLNSVRMDFDIVPPAPWRDAVMERAGFRLVLEPPDADVEAVLGGQARLHVHGPAGRTVRWTLDARDVRGGLIKSEVLGRKPVTASAEQIAGMLKTAVRSFSEAIDAAHRIDLNVSIDELGALTRRFVHKVEPLRWWLDAANGQVRLIDETDHALPLIVERYDLQAPLTRQIVLIDLAVAGVLTPPPGALFSAVYAGRRYSVLASTLTGQSMHAFSELNLVPALDLPASPAAAVLVLATALGLWREARPIGHQALLRKTTVLSRLRHALVTAACGHDFANDLDAIDAEALVRAQKRVSQDGFGSLMRTDYWPALADARTDLRFSDYAERYRVESDPLRCSLAITLAFHPEQLRFEDPSTAEQQIAAVLTNHRLIRGAFLAQASAVARNSAPERLAQAG